MGRAQNIYFPFFVRRRWEKDNQIIPYLKICNLFLDRQRSKDKKYLVFYNRKNLQKIKQIKNNKYIPFVEPTNDYLTQTTFVIDFDLKEELPGVNEKILDGYQKLNEFLNDKCLLVRSSSGFGWHIIFVANGNIEPKNYQQLQKDIINFLFSGIEEYIDYNASLSKKQGFYHLAHFPDWIENGYINITQKNQGKARKFWTDKIALNTFEIHELQDKICPFQNRTVDRLDADISKTLEFIEKSYKLNVVNIQNSYLLRLTNIIGEVSQSENFQIQSLLHKYNFSSIKNKQPLAAEAIESNIRNISRYSGYYNFINRYLEIEEEYQDFFNVDLFADDLQKINLNKKVNQFFASNQKDKISYFQDEIKKVDDIFIKHAKISLIEHTQGAFNYLQGLISKNSDKNVLSGLSIAKRFIKFVFEIRNNFKLEKEDVPLFQANEQFVDSFLEKTFTQTFDHLLISKQNQQTLKKIWREERDWLKAGFNNLLFFIFRLKMSQENIFIDIGLEDFKKYWNTHERKATALRQLIMPGLAKSVNEYKPHWKRRGFMIDWIFFDNFLSKDFIFTPKYLAGKMGNGNTWQVIRIYAKPLVNNYGLYEACKIFNEAVWLSEAKNKRQRIREFAVFARKISKQLQEQKCRSQAQMVELS